MPWANQPFSFFVRHFCAPRAEVANKEIIPLIETLRLGRLRRMASCPGLLQTSINFFAIIPCSNAGSVHNPVSLRARAHHRHRNRSKTPPYSHSLNHWTSIGRASCPIISWCFL